MIQERLAKGSLSGVVRLIQDFVQTAEVVNTDDVVFTEIPIVEEEDFLDGILPSIRRSGEWNQFDRLKAVDWEGLQKSLEPLLGILLVHFEDPGSGFDGVIERHIASDKLEIGKLLVEGTAHGLIEFLVWRAFGVDAEDPAGGGDVLGA